MDGHRGHPTEGPVLIEVNTGGGFDLPQLASGRGFLTDEVGDFLQKLRIANIDASVISERNNMVSGHGCLCCRADPGVGRRRKSSRCSRAAISSATRSGRRVAGLAGFESGVRGVPGRAVRAGGEFLLVGALPGAEGAGAGGRRAGVLIPAFTFAAVPSAIVHAGCEPVLVNVGANYRIETDEFAAKLAEGAGRGHRRPHARPHVGHGRDRQGSAPRGTVPMIEDAAHSLRNRWAGRLVGTMGRVGCFSFQSYKLVNAGEGGMLVTRDPEVIARAVIMSGAYEHNWKKHPLVQRPLSGAGRTGCRSTTCG